MEENMKVIINPNTERVRIEYQEPREYIFTGSQCDLTSTQAVIDLINKRGSAENTLIYYLDKPDKPTIQVILDDTIQDRDQDTAVYRFEESDLLKEWKAVFGESGIDQKNFIKFLKRRDASEFTQPALLQELLAIAQTLNIATVINFDSMYQNENNKEVSFKIKDADSSTYIPDTFRLQIPLYNESDLISEIEIELELVKPRDEGQKARFVLSCPRLPKDKKLAIQYEIDKIRKELPGYTLLAGSAR
jgi:hypothetical protein